MMDYIINDSLCIHSAEKRIIENCSVEINAPINVYAPVRELGLISMVGIRLALFLPCTPDEAGIQFHNCVVLPTFNRRIEGRFLLYLEIFIKDGDELKKYFMWS